MPTKHKSKKKFSARSLVAIGVIVVTVLSIGAWKLGSKASSDDWQFYVSVHYGNPSQGNPETKTTVVDGLKSDDGWTAFRFTSLCDFSGPGANVARYMDTMSRHPMVLQMEHPADDVIIAKLQQPLDGPSLTEFTNLMLEGLVQENLNNCDGTA